MAGADEGPSHILSLMSDGSKEAYPPSSPPEMLYPLVLSKSSYD